MTEIYGHKWVSSVGDNPNEGAALTWAKGLAGLSRQNLAAGLRGCLTRLDPWPPSLNEFRGMCLEIPSFAQFRLDKDRATPFAVLVWSKVDSYRARHVTAEQTERMLRDGYQLACEHLMAGGALPDAPVAALAEEKRKPVKASPEVVAAAARVINNLLNGDSV